MAGTGDFLSQYVLGKTKKAIIFVPIPRDAPGAGQEDNRLQQVMSDANTVETQLRSLAKNAMTSYSDITMSIANKRSTAQNNVSARHFNVIEVQYNPKSLEFMGAGGVSVSYGSGFGELAANQIQQVTQDTTTTLSCELIFSNINTFDAFTIDGKTALNLDTLAGGIVGLANRKKGFSVQPMLDGFIAMMAQDYTRNVIFCWGPSVFRGEVTRVDGSYRMFNKRGEPILATVNLEIRQGDEEERRYDENYWKAQFAKAFKPVR